MGDAVKPGLDGKAIQMAAVSTGDLKAGHGSAEYIQGVENQRAMKVPPTPLPVFLPMPPVDPAHDVKLPHLG